MSQDQLVLLPLWYAMFLLAITCHEAAHAFAALRGGDPTAYRGGQVTLNPLPHVQREPFGTVLIPMMTFFWTGWMMGWASAPYDPSWEDRHPRRAALMAAAGPMANLLLAVVAFAILKVGLATGYWEPHFIVRPDGYVEYVLDQLVRPASESGATLEAVGRLCSIMLTLNFLLFLFNLIPVPPLDGASVVSGLFAPARELRDRLRTNPTSGLIGLVIAWYCISRAFNPAYGWVLAWLLP